jgi:hypothetical protein
VELGQPEALRVLDHHDAGIRNVHADLDHGGRDQHMDGAGDECGHDLVLLRRFEPPMEQADGEVGEDVALQLGRERSRRLEIELFGLLDQGRNKAQSDRHHHCDLMHRYLNFLQRIEQPFERIGQNGWGRGIRQH